MRYWGEDKGKQTRGGNMKRRAKHSQRTSEPRRQRPASGEGAVTPFLRRLYRQGAATSGPVQRLLLLLVLAGLIYAFVLGDSGAIRIAMLRSERADLERQVAELQDNAERLQREIARLESNAFYIEKAGRERFGYVMPDEKVYRIVAEED
jgi:cell division protein FtsB